MIAKKNIEKRLSILANGEKCEVIKITAIKDGAHLVRYNCNDVLDCSCVVYDDGTLMHLQDWQSGYPETADEVKNYKWLSEDVHEAIIFNGLPRTL